MKRILLSVFLVLGTYVLTAPVNEGPVPAPDDCTDAICWVFVGKSGTCEDLVTPSSDYYGERAAICKYAAPNDCPLTCESISGEEASKKDKGTPAENKAIEESSIGDNNKSPDASENKAVKEDLPKDDCESMCWDFSGMSGRCDELLGGGRVNFNLAVDICNGNFAEGCPNTCHYILQENAKHPNEPPHVEEADITTGGDDEDGNNKGQSNDPQTGNTNTEECKDSIFLYEEKEYSCFKLTQTQSGDLYNDRKALCSDDEIRSKCCKSCKSVDSEKLDVPSLENEIKVDYSVKTSPQLETIYEIIQKQLDIIISFFKSISTKN